MRVSGMSECVSVCVKSERQLLRNMKHKKSYTIKRRRPNAHPRRNRADIHNPRPRTRQVRLGSLYEQKHPPHINIKHIRERPDVRLGNTRESGDGACVVDNDVDRPPRKRLERRGDHVPPVREAAGVGLHGRGAHAEGLDGGDVLEGGGFVAVVVDDDLGLCVSVLESFYGDVVRREKGCGWCGKTDVGSLLG